jgi:flagellar assembly protein FliH
MSDILRFNGNSKKVKLKLLNSTAGTIEAERHKEEDYLQTGLQNYYDRGYNEGRENTREELKSEFEKLFEEHSKMYNSVINKINEQTAGYSKIFETLVIDLAFMIAEKITQTELSKKIIINETLRNSLKKVIGSNNIIARLNPGDLKIISEKTSLIAKDCNLSHVKFEADEHISPGGCFIETEIGNVDARISTQFAELKKIVKDTV